MNTDEITRELKFIHMDELIFLFAFDGRCEIKCKWMLFLLLVFRLRVVNLHCAKQKTFV